MTELLEKAFSEVSKLPQQEQDSFATWIIEELASEHRWQENFSKSQDVLERLADEAILEHRSGKTRLLDWERI